MAKSVAQQVEARAKALFQLYANRERKARWADRSAQIRWVAMVDSASVRVVSDRAVVALIDDAGWARFTEIILEEAWFDTTQRVDGMITREPLGARLQWKEE